MTLSEWITSNLKLKGWTIEVLIEKSTTIEIAKLEEEKNEQLEKLKCQNLTAEALTAKTKIIENEFEKKKVAPGIGRQTVLRAKNNSTKISQNTIEKFANAFGSDPEPNLGYFCKEYTPKEESIYFHHCNICQVPFFVEQKQPRDNRAYNYYKKSLQSRKLFEIGISLHKIKQFDPQCDQYFIEREEDLGLSRQGKKAPGSCLKYIICEKCFRQNKEKFGKPYNEILQNILDNYQQYNISKLAKIMGVNPISIKRILASKTNFIPFHIAHALTDITLKEEPFIELHAAGCITERDCNNLYADFLHNLYRLGIKPQQTYNGKIHLLEQLKTEKKLTDYEINQLTLQALENVINRRIPKLIPVKSSVTAMRGLVTINGDKFVDVQKYIEGSIMIGPGRLGLRTLILLFTDLVTQEEYSQFVQSEEFFKVRAKCESIGLISLNKTLKLPYKGGLMGCEDEVSYICPILVEVRGMTVACFPRRSESNKLNDDLVHIAKTFKATMICLMLIDVQDGQEQIREYQYFNIIKNLDCYITMTIQPTESPFNGTYLASL